MWPGWKSLVHGCWTASLVTAFANLSGCATSDSAVRAPYGARVSPVHAGFDLESSRGGSGIVYVWHVHDYDGTNHTLTWIDTGGTAREVVKRFDACVRNDCAMRMRSMSASPSCSNEPARPPLFPGMLDCARSSEMTDYRETIEPDATEYDVLIVTGDAARNMAAGAIPLSRYLGARRKVTSVVPADKKKVVADVENCLRGAAARGVVESCASLGRCTTIMPMVDRFDSCLRAHSYAVETPANQEQPAVANER